MTAPATIRQAVDGEAERLGRVIARACAAPPRAAWLGPDASEPPDAPSAPNAPNAPVTPLAALAGRFGLLVAQAMRYGDVYVAGEAHAVAGWLPPGEVPEVDGYDASLAAACGPYAPRFAALDALMRDRRPAEPGHARLVFLAVDVPWRGRGLGTALLDTHHARLDAAGTPVRLEASDPGCRRLYQRHGYVDHGPAYGPDGVIAFHPMRRDPASFVAEAPAAR